jgi:putative acetyltransferase
MTEFKIVEDDLSGDGTIQLLKIHLAGMHASSPPKRADVTVWTVRLEDAAVGIGALKSLGDAHGEIKSMRTHPDHLRQGIAARLLDHILLEARKRGLRQLTRACSF